METTPSKVKYFLYARKSTESEDRQMLSIDSQIAELKEIALKEGLQIAAVLSESGSAKKLGRPVFNDMLDQIEAGKAGGIICWKLDRLARNMVDGGRVIEDIQQGVIKHIRTFEGSHYPADNVMLMAVIFGMSNQYSIDLGTNIKRGLRARLAENIRPCMAPIGYRNIRVTDRRVADVVPDENTFNDVRKLFDLTLTGRYAPYQILQMINEETELRVRARSDRPSKKMSCANLYRILRNPFYYGEFEFPQGSGNWYQGKHKPMITKSEFDRVQEIMDGKRTKIRNNKNDLAYTGIMKCPCGAGITSELKWKHQKNGNVHRYVYYHCTRKIDRNCKEPLIREEELERQIKEYIAQIEIPAEMHEWALAELKVTRKQDKGDIHNVIAAKRASLTRCQSKLDALLELRMSREIDNDTYASKKASLDMEKRELEGQIANADQKILEWFEDAQRKLSFAERARREFDTGDIKKRREILQLLGTNHLLKQKKLYISIEKPLLMLTDKSVSVRTS